MSDGSGNTTGDIIRNILLFLIVGAVIVIGILYLMSEINAEEAVSTEGLASIVSVVARL